MRNYLKRLFRYDIDAYFLYQLSSLKKSELGLSSKSSSHSKYDIVSVTREEDLEEVCELRNINLGALKNRLSQGDKLFSVKADGRLVSTIWVGLNNSPLRRGFAAVLSRLPDGIILYDIYVSPEHRGHNLQKMMMEWCVTNFASRKNIYTYMFVGVNNMASIINAERCFQKKRLIYHLSIELPKIKINLFPKYKKESWKELEIKY